MFSFVFLFECLVNYRGLNIRESKVLYQLTVKVIKCFKRLSYSWLLVGNVSSGFNVSENNDHTCYGK